MGVALDGSKGLNETACPELASGVRHLGKMDYHALTSPSQNRGTKAPIDTPQRPNKNATEMPQKSHRDVTMPQICQRLHRDPHRDATEMPQRHHRR